MKRSDGIVGAAIGGLFTALALIVSVVVFAILPRSVQSQALGFVTAIQGAPGNQQAPWWVNQVPNVTETGIMQISNGNQLYWPSPAGIAISGRQVAAGQLNNSTLICLCAMETSADYGRTWATAISVWNGNQTIAQTTASGVNYSIATLLGGHETHYRFRMFSYTSGTAELTMRVTNNFGIYGMGGTANGVVAAAPPAFASSPGLAAVLSGAQPAATASGQLTRLAGDVYGRLDMKQRQTWSLVPSVPASATQATVTQGAGAAGVRNVANCITVSLVTGATPTAGTVRFNLRDGASGAGTILWSVNLAATATVGGTATYGHCGFWLEGSAATAMTIESSAAPPAGISATAWASGTTSQ